MQHSNTQHHKYSVVPQALDFSLCFSQLGLRRFILFHQHGIFFLQFVHLFSQHFIPACRSCLPAQSFNLGFSTLFGPFERNIFGYLLVLV